MRQSLVGNIRQEKIMQSEYQSQSQIPHHPHVPFEIRHAVIEERVSAQLWEVKRVGEDAKKVKLIVQEYRDQHIYLMGCEKYEKFRAYVSDQKRFKAKYFFPPRGPEMSKDEIDRFSREQREESQGFLRELGVDINQFRSLTQRAAAYGQELGPSHPIREGKRVMVILPSDVPQEIRAHKTNPWTVVGPPYGWAWWYAGSTDGVTFIPTLYLDAATGLVGNVSFLRDSDASDNDYGHIKYSTTVSFWYQMPAAGLVEVWIEAVARSAHHHLSLINEFGWSDSSVNQHNYLTLNASLGGSTSELQMSEMSWFTESGYVEGYWDNHYLTNGGTYWANLKSDPRVIFPAGSWLLVEVGTLNFHSCFVNDVEVYSNMDFSWVIKHVSVHSTGG